MKHCLALADIYRPSKSIQYFHLLHKGNRCNHAVATYKSAPLPELIEIEAIDGYHFRIVGKYMTMQR